jgi:hypothetical protein
MIKRMTLVLAATALAVSGSSLANAATKTTKHKAKSHAVTATVSIANINPPGPTVTSGSQSYAGTVDGTISGKAVSGAVRGVNTYSGATFTGTLTVFSKTGTLSAKITGSGKAATLPNTGVDFSGTGTYTGGTNAYKGAKGKFTFSGNEPAGANVATFTTTGKAKY